LTTWVLLRGLIREHRHWGNFPALLAERTQSTVLTPDLPGNGRHWRLRSPASIDGMLDFCRNELLTLGHPPPYQVLALSLGAMVASCWATRYPSELSAVVMVNTSLRPFSPFWHRLRPRNYLQLIRRGLGTDGTALERLILELTCRRQDPALAADWLRFRVECPVSRTNAIRQLLAASRFRAPRLAPAVPMMVVAGQKDCLVDPACSHALAAAWQLPLACHPSAGHDLPHDDGPWLVDIISAWQLENQRVAEAPAQILATL
jgi:pimeloyl-ACP methyl ester carboxylesterase